MIFKGRSILKVLAVLLVASIGIAGENTKLNRVEQLIVEKRFTEAIRTAVEDFEIDISQCADIKVQTILDKTTQDEQISARTSYDQIIILDPDQVAFQSARFLISTLMHEATHCRQHQKIYEQLVLRNKNLADFLPLKSLKDLATLDKLANQKDVSLFNKKAGGLLKQTDPKWFMDLTNEMVNGAQVFDQLVGEVIEMQACLEAFMRTDVLSAPIGSEKASTEFAFQYRYLMNAFVTFKHKRQIMGATTDSEVCSLNNVVPSILQNDFEISCIQSAALLNKYLENVPE